MRLIAIRDVDDDEIVGHVAVEEAVTARAVHAEYRLRKPDGDLWFQDLGVVDFEDLDVDIFERETACVCRGFAKDSLHAAVAFACELEDGR